MLLVACILSSKTSKGFDSKAVPKLNHCRSMQKLNRLNRNCRALFKFCVVTLAILLAGCAMKSKPKVTMSTLSPGAAASAAALHPPPIIYVTDFYLSPEMIQAAPSVIGSVSGGGPLSRLREDAQRLRGDDLQTKAKKL